MKKIRNEVFETNSSSMHSICIVKNKTEDRYTPKEIVDGVWVFGDGSVELSYDECSFGREPFEILCNLFRKTLYAFASFGAERSDEITRIFVKAYNEAADKVGEDHMREFCFDTDYDDEVYYGDIDHQSRGLLQRFLDNNKISLEEFLLNPKYVVVIDGDEYWQLQKYQNAGLLEELEVVQK